MADKTFPAVLVKDPLLKDIDTFSVTRNSGGTFDATVGYSLKDEAGAVYKTGSCVVALSGSALTSLGTFLTANALPTIRTQEGM